LATNLHGEGERIDNDENEDAIFEASGRDEPPDLVLEADAWNVAALWLHLQSEFYTFPLTQPHTEAWFRNAEDCSTVEFVKFDNVARD